MQAQLHMHAAATGQFNRRLVAVIAGVEHDDFITAANHRLNGAKNRLGGAWRDGHFSVGIHRDAIAAGDLGRHLLTQHRQACHGGVLVMTEGDVLTHCIEQTLRTIEIGKTLGQIERAGFGGELRHGGENGRADVWQLTGDHGSPLRVSCKF